MVRLRNSQIYGERFAAFVLVGAIALTLSGCSSDEEIGSYEVARDEAPDSSEHPGTKPPHAVPQGEGQQLAYDTPEGWTQGDVRGMRKAAFRVDNGEQKAEITVIDMPAMVGRMLLDNVNEWRRQIQLDPITEAELEKTVRPIEVAGVEGHYVELLGPEDAESRRGVLAVVAIHGSKSWFFKLLGDAELALQEKERFQDFVKSVKFETPTESPKETPKVTPKESPKKEASPVAVPHGPAPSMVATPDVRFECDSPEGWTPGEAQGMRKAIFKVEDGDQSVEITATAFPATVGRLLLMNVNRWRKQVELDEITQEQLDQTVRPIQVADVQGTYAELIGPEDAEPCLTILGVVVVCEGKAWFLKMKGDAELAQREKQRFQDYVESVRFTVVEAPTEEAAAKKPKETTPEEAPTDETPSEKPASRETTAEGDPTEQTPTEESVPKEATTEEKPAKEAPTGEAPANEATTKEATAEGTDNDE